MRAADWLWANPVLKRESAQARRPISRLRLAGSWMCLTLILLAYAAGAYWLSRPQRSPWEARAFLLLLSLLYLLWISVAAPGPAAVGISGERERRTWQALLLTALRPSQVVSGKLVASLQLPVTALIQILPLLVMSAHAARLPMTRLASLVVVLLGASAVIVSASLWLSGRCRHSRTAIALAYLTSAGFFWGVLAGSPPHLGHAKNLWWYASPVWQIAVLCLAEPRLLPTTRPLFPEWEWFFLGCAAFSGLAVALLIRRVGSVRTDA